MRLAILASALTSALVLFSGCASRHVGEQPAATGRDSASVPVDTASASDSSSAEAAIAVVRDYYAALGARDYSRAYLEWDGAGAASGKTLDAFAAGFANTHSVSVSPGEPAPIGAAAGSRYIEIPVAIAAITGQGAPQRFHGTYVLRRSEVDGATAEQRRWHLYSAKITRDSSVTR